MKNVLSTMTLLILLVGCFNEPRNENTKENKQKSTVEKKTEDGLNWQTFDEKILKENLGKKPVIIYFWAEWCTPCHQLRKLTFVNAEVKSKLQNFLLFKVDATEQENNDVIKLQEKYKVDSLPVVVFYNEKGELKESLTLNGFEPPLEFILRLQKL